MSDRGHDDTDAIIRRMSREVRREYAQAAKEVQDKLEDYFRRFRYKDEAWLQMVTSGEKTQAEYYAWRKGQMIVGIRWHDLRDELAENLHHANVIARSIVEGYMPEIYATNHNFATYQIETLGGISTSYSLYSREAVEKILREQPELLPPLTPGSKVAQAIAMNNDLAWQARQIQSVTLQAILQGESIPHMAARIANTMGEIDHKTTIRYARTAATCAQNAGRQDAFRRAQALGVNMQREWIATLDNRTRHEHRLLDGQRRGVDEPFEVEGYEIMYPGDPTAEGFLIWNCRCTERAVVSGWEDRIGALRSDAAIGGMSYDEWLEATPISHSITKQEEIARAMAAQYTREIYSGKRKGG